MTIFETGCSTKIAGKESLHEKVLDSSGGSWVMSLSIAASALAQAEKAPAKQVTKIGYLSCFVASGWGFIFGSSRSLQCVYTPAEKGKKIENHFGSITKFGADIGYLQSGVILWTVLTPGMKITENPRLLAGHYGGATASATVGLRVGGHVLVGGMDGSISAAVPFRNSIETSNESVRIRF